LADVRHATRVGTHRVVNKASFDQPTLARSSVIPGKLSKSATRLDAIRDADSGPLPGSGAARTRSAHSVTVPSVLTPLICKAATSSEVMGEGACTQRIG
jgi:hypothetical protein